MQENKVDRVHRLAELLVYDLELPNSVRHPVRFFFANDIRRAAGLPELPIPDSGATCPMFKPSASSHTSACNCRFCATGVFNTFVPKPLP